MHRSVPQMLRTIVHAATLTCALAAMPARAASPEPTIMAPGKLEPKVHTIRWNPAWGKVRWPELTLTAVAAGVAIAGQIITPIGKSWNSSLVGDDDVRPVLRLDSSAERRTARDYSDVLLTSLVAFPIIFDALVVGGWSRQSSEVAGQMVLMDAEVFAVVMALQGTANVLANRQRPYAVECGGELAADSVDCEGTTRQRSFFSGHTSAAFAAASLMCTHQANLDLYQNKQLGGVICASGYLLAATTGALRIASDVHNMSDVVVGATVGTLVGLGLPWLFHYRFGDIDDPVEESPGPTVRLAPMGLGLGAYGSF